MPFERFPVEKPAVLKASTPGGHPVIRAVWLGGFLSFAVGAVLFALHSFAFEIPLLIAGGWMLAGLVAYGVRHARFLGTLAPGGRTSGVPAPRPAGSRRDDRDASGRRGRGAAGCRDGANAAPRRGGSLRTPRRRRARVPRLSRWRRAPRARRRRRCARDVHAR